MNGYAIYFSPTDTSKKGVLHILSGISEDILEIDITVPKEIEKTSFSKEDIVVFGMPVYGGRLFLESKERLKVFKGNQTPCVITVTYGNRDFDDALLELYDLVVTLGFIPIAGAALIGQHTYGSIQIGRPNQKDQEEDKLFGLKIKDKIIKQEYSYIAVPGHRPYKEGGQGGHFLPTTSNNCNHCGKCANLCPMQAINYHDYAIDATKCIACFRCIKVCPVHAKNMNSQEYMDFAKMFSKKLETRKENQYFI